MAPNRSTNAAASKNPPATAPAGAAVAISRCDPSPSASPAVTAAAFCTAPGPNATTSESPCRQTPKAKGGGRSGRLNAVDRHALDQHVAEPQPFLQVFGE